MDEINHNAKGYEVINNPGAGNCMFWAVMMAYLNPEKFNQNEIKFKEKYYKLFKTEVGVELFYKNFQENTIQAKILVQLFRENIAKSCETWLPIWHKKFNPVSLKSAFQENELVVYNLDEYVTEMKKNGTFGEEKALTVIKHELGIRILIVREKDVAEPVKQNRPFADKREVGYFLDDNEADINSDLEIITIVYNQKQEHYQYYGVKIPTVEFTVQDYVEQLEFIKQIGVSSYAEEQFEAAFNLEQQSDKFAYNTIDQELRSVDELTLLLTPNIFDHNLEVEEEMLDDDEDTPYSLFDGYVFTNNEEEIPVVTDEPLTSLVTFGKESDLTNAEESYCQIKLAPTSTEMDWGSFETFNNIPQTLASPTNETFDEIRMVAVFTNKNVTTNNLLKKQENIAKLKLF